MKVELTEKTIVVLHEELTNKIIRELSNKHNEEEKVMKAMMEISRQEGYNILEARDFIDEFEKNRKKGNK